MKKRITMCLVVGLVLFSGGTAWGAGTEGDPNNFFGTGAGAVNTTGHNNSFFGAFAGTSNTEGSYNSFFGYKSGYSQTTNGEPSMLVGNSFFGAYSGYSNTEGIGNSFFGTESGKYNTADGNSFFGEGAGLNHTIGDANTFVGVWAGLFHDSGEGNTFIGAAAGNESGQDQEANYNTYIGTAAGGAATGSNNVFLGAFAGQGETGSNKLYISNSDTSTPLIYGEFDNEFLEVNGDLNVNGSIQALFYVGDGSQLTGISVTETDPTVNALGKTALSCSVDQVVKWNGFLWSCADDIDTDTDTTLSETEVDSMVSNNGYLTSESDPTVNSLGKTVLYCSASQVAKWSGSAWVCADDDNDADTTLSEAEVDAYVANNGYAQLDLTGGSLPPLADCDDSSEYGRMKVDEINEYLYICAVSGWVRIKGK